MNDEIYVIISDSDDSDRAWNEAAAELFNRYGSNVLMRLADKEVSHDGYRLGFRYTFEVVK